jgi:hypothetical protein
VAVPRPISSRITSALGPAWFRIAAVSTISTMKVERPRARSSAAPTRLNSGRRRRYAPSAAGTKAPACARTAISAFWRRKVDLPAMFGPVTSQTGRASSPSAELRRSRWRRRPGALPAQGALDHRMAAALIAKARRGVDRGRVQSPSIGQRGEAGGDVEFRQRPRAGGEARAPRPDGLAQRVEDGEFEVERPGAGVGDLRFEVGEFDRGEAQRAGHGLAVDEARLSGGVSSFSPCAAETSMK